MTTPFRPTPVRPPLSRVPVGRAREGSSPFLRPFLPAPQNDAGGAQTVLESLPVVGDVLGAVRGVKAAKAGRIGEAAWEALFAALPFFSVPAVLRGGAGKTLETANDTDVIRAAKALFHSNEYRALTEGNPASTHATILRRHLTDKFMYDPERLDAALNNFLKPKVTKARPDPLWRESRPAHVADVIDNLRSAGLDDAAANLEKFIEPSKVKTVMAHGTKARAPFDIFRTNPEHMGIHVGTVGQAHYIGGRSIFPLAIRAENPLPVAEDPGTMWLPYLLRREFRPVLGEGLADSYLRILTGAGRAEERDIYEQVVKSLDDAGVDAISYKNPYENAIRTKRGDTIGRTSYAVFRPEQVKSLLGNAGTFNPNDPSMIR